MPRTLCPNCGETFGSLMLYCPECSRSWEHNSGVTVCQHPPNHEGDRKLYCAGCGCEAVKEGVIAPDGLLIPYPTSVIANILKGNSIP